MWARRRRRRRTRGRGRGRRLWEASRFCRKNRPSRRLPDPLRPPSSSPSSAPAARSVRSPPATATTRPGASTPPARSSLGPPPPSPGTPAPPSPIPRCPASRLPRAPPGCSGTCDRRPSRRTPSRRPVYSARRSGTESASPRAPRAYPVRPEACAATRISRLCTRAG